MRKINKDVVEYRRFLFIPTLFTGLFLIFIIRLYWEPALQAGISSTSAANDWVDRHYAIWGPIWQYGFNCLRRGEIPHWNPYQLCGQPYLIEPRSALFQPLHVFFWQMDFARAYQIHVFLCTFLIGMGFFIWARIVGLPYLTIFVALMSVLTTAPFLWVQLDLNFLSGSVWMVLLLPAIAYFFESPLIKNFVLLMVIWVLLILSGSIECILSGAIWMLISPYVYRFIPTIQGTDRPIKNVLLLGIVIIMGLVCTAFYWFPYAIWVWENKSTDELIRTTLQLGDFPHTFSSAIYQLLLPFLHPTELSQLPVLYVGIIPIIFLGCAVLDRETRRSALVHGAILAVFLSLSFISHPIVPCVYRGFTLYYSISIAILLGLGVNRVFLKGRDWRSPYIWASGGIVITLSLLGIIFATPWHKGIAILLLLIILPSLLLRWKVLRLISITGMIILLFIDNFVTLRRFIPENYITAIESKNLYDEVMNKIRFKTGTGRTYLFVDTHTALWSENLGMFYHWHVMNGSHIPMDSRAKNWFDEINKLRENTSTLVESPFLRYAQVHWMCTSTPIFFSNSETSPWRKSDELPNLILYENLLKIPRCFITPNYVFVSSFEEAIRYLSSTDFDVTQECVVEKPVPTDSHPPLENQQKKANTADTTPMSSAIIQQETNDRVDVAVKTDTGGMLVLLDTYSSGWEARLNGMETPIFIANGMFRGVYVPPGEHQVVFQYITPGWHLGLLVSLAGVGITIISLFIGKVWLGTTE